MRKSLSISHRCGGGAEFQPREGLPEAEPLRRITVSDAIRLLAMYQKKGR